MAIATREAYGDALLELVKNNDDIIVFDADLSKSTKTCTVLEEFPQKHINCGIAEANMICMAAGMATTGKIPFVSSFAMFLAGRGFEQIRNSIAYSKLNVKLCATHAGITVGEDGASHQAIEDLAIMRAVPNMVVLNPADAVETAAILNAAAKYDGPCYIRLGRLGVPQTYSEAFEYEIGKADVLNEGTKITVCATGYMVHIAQNIAAEFPGQIEVINVSTIKPLDINTILKSAKKTNHIVTLEEHSVIGGLGGAIKESIAEVYPCKVNSFGLEDVFGTSGKPLELLKEYELDFDSLVRKIGELL